MTDAELSGLRGEVQGVDIYGIRGLYFVPDVVFDFGANVGIFAEHARATFPKAEIICVEPNPQNFAELSIRMHGDANVRLINKAIGNGDVFHYLGAANGAMECYITTGVGYPKGSLQDGDGVEKSSIEAILPSWLISEYGAGKSFIVKMDIEGGEGAVFADPTSMKALAKADYLALEVHRYAANGQHIDSMNEATTKALASFHKTHDCDQKHVIFTATRRR